MREGLVPATVPAERTRGKGLKLIHGRFRLRTRKQFWCGQELYQAVERGGRVTIPRYT